MSTRPAARRGAEEEAGRDGIGLRCLGLLMRLYPRDFRDTYREPILQSVRDALGEAGRTGMWALFCLWARAARDLTRGGTRMRLRAMARRPASPDPGPGGRRTFRGRLGREADVLAGDLRHATRNLVRSPVMTVAVIGTLAVAIGLTTLTFGVVYAITSRDLPYPDPGSLVEIGYWGRRLDDRPGQGRVTFPLKTLGDVPASLQAVGEFAEHQVALTDGDEVSLLRAAEVTADVFEVLGVRPLLGRTFAAADEVPGAPPTVVLGYRLWMDRFEGDPSALGETLAIDGTVRTVIGVMPEGFSFSYYAMLWVPRDPERHAGAHPIDVGMVGRLRDGAGIEQANAELELLRRQLADAAVAPFDEQSDEWSFQLEARPLGWERFDELGWLPFTALLPVGIALLVACANVAGLLIARGATRRHEMTLRAVIGGSGSRLVRHLLTESMVLATSAGLLGLLLVAGSGRMVRLIAERVFDEAFPFGLAELGIDSPIPGWLRLTPDATVAAFAVVASVLAVAAIGFVPARATARPDFGAALRAGGYGHTAGRRSRRWQKVLTATQVAMSVVLIGAAVLTLRSSSVLSHFDMGVDVDRVVELTFRNGPPGSLAELADTNLTEVKRQAIERYRMLPGVEAVTSTWFADGEKVQRRTNLNGESFLGVAAPETLAPMRGLFGRVVGADHFQTLGLEIRRGRGIEERDDAAAQRVAVISESVAALGWPGQEPLGRQIRLLADGPGYTVVGIVEDQRRTNGLRNAGQASAWHHIYVPAEQVGMAPSQVFVRAAGKPAAIAPALRRVTREIDPAVPLTVQRLNGNRPDALMVPLFRWAGAMMIGIGSAALALSAIGIFSVIAHAATQRTREMGLRAALGADRASLVGLGLRGAMGMTGTGIALGIIAAMASGKLLASFLYGVTAFDPLLYAAIAGAVVCVALVAAWLPARRAARVDPAVALRED